MWDSKAYGYVKYNNATIVCIMVDKEASLKKVIGTVGLMLIMSGCLHGSAKDAVRALLIDPDSAKFEDVSWAGKGTVTCGFVNSKNVYGGYTGWTAFVYDGDAAYLIKGPQVPGSRLFSDKCSIDQRRRYINIQIREAGPLPY